MNKIYDVLVIGSGGAGLSAALSAKKNVKSVAVVTKGYPTHAQTVQAQGGINAVLDFEIDSFENHINDTKKSAHGLCNIENIKIMCESAGDSINWLFELGVPFSMNKNNKIAQRKFGGTKHQRTCYSSDYTGLKILHTLHENAIKEDIEFINEHLLLNIIVEEGMAKGVTLLDILNSEVVEISAKKVIIATGGYGNIYNGFTTNSHATTGDGVAAALRAGCKLSNMEFVQFHPTAMKHGNILISESARGEGGYLVNDKGERFVEELKTRDEVARAIYKELEKSEDVFLDLRHLGLEKINETMPQERVLAMQFSGVKIEEELLPIRPAMHYCMGGIKTDGRGKTNIKNLYACGEAAQNGVHGANRLGGNSLLEIVVFGKIAGDDASKTIEDVEFETNSRQYVSDKNFINALFDYPNKIDFYEKKEDMGKIFFKNVGLFRSEKSMNSVLSQVKQWQEELTNMGIGDKSRYYNKNLSEFIEFVNMLELSESVVVSAINRRESRGAHFRVDYDKENEEYTKESISYKIDGVLAVDFEDVK